MDREAESMGVEVILAQYSLDQARGPDRPAERAIEHLPKVCCGAVTAGGGDGVEIPGLSLCTISMYLATAIRKQRKGTRNGLSVVYRMLLFSASVSCVESSMDSCS